MITKDQTKELASLFQIDEFTVFREYLQLTFLSYLYQEKDSGKLFFKGGTALRLLFDSPRFSEDLDFSTTLSGKEIKDLLDRLEAKLVRELSGIKIVPLYKGKEGIRFRIKYASSGFKYPFSVRLDFHQAGKIEKTGITTLITQFPVIIFPQVLHLSPEGILKEKLDALSSRCKGRDIFDTWFLLSKNIKLPKGYNLKKAVKNIEKFSNKELDKDLGKFLPKSQKSIIPTLKKELINKLTS